MPKTRSISQGVLPQSITSHSTKFLEKFYSKVINFLSIHLLFLNKLTVSIHVVSTFSKALWISSCEECNKFIIPPAAVQDSF